MRLSRDAKIILGYGGVLIGAWFLREGYERSGRPRPFLARFLP